MWGVTFRWSCLAGEPGPLELGFRGCPGLLSAVAPQPWPHLAPRVAGPGAQVDVAAVFPVVDAVWVGQRGHGPHAGEELAEVGGVPAAAAGPGYGW